MLNIRLVSLYSTIKMMHGPINIRYAVFFFVGEEEVHPGLCEQILDFFTSLFRIINRSSYIGTNIIMMVHTFCLVLTCIKEHSFVVCFSACYCQITTTDLYFNNQVNLPCLVLGLPSWGQACLKLGGNFNFLFFHLPQIVKVYCKRCVLCKSHWSKCVYTWELNYYAGMEYYISQLADICVAAVVQHFMDPSKPAPFHDEVFTFSCGICHIPIAGSVYIWHGPYRCWTTRRSAGCEPASDRFQQDQKIAMWTSLYQGNEFHLVYIPEVYLWEVINLFALW